ncbi:tRNA preQ1(34) S-adenosylmethionine ribosyltransferase-isomerase QueA, partial [Candidatus Entotheonella palauensis]|uniref:tRNA preQ1(34) S-adenosylmethionine ribosyltransferase-isomerase QueA n=1 Tax=Candidatus Entotheonella palauensis TaxID=93172 RepID=UPI000B7D64C0
MNLNDFNFTLPPERIAHTPAARRDASRLMIVDRQQQRITHDVFANIGHYLRPNDVLVVNDTKVIPARLHGRKAGTGGKVEVFLLHDHGEGMWDVLLKPAARARPETVIDIGPLQAKVIERLPDAMIRVQFTPSDIYDLLEQVGEVPLPPYIQRHGHQDGVEDHPGKDRERYQTVYAQQPGAVAAPTAGLHFTPELLTHLEQLGIRRATVTLHVGWGTFQPIRSAQVTDHRMAKEYYRLIADEAACIRQAQAHGGRVVAVGTTSTRTLETILQEIGEVGAKAGWSDLFIYPSYRFRIVDALVTNFHLPQSTLFLLVCAFAGRDLMLEAYHCAIAERYRFYSYGDAMLI